MKVFVLASLAKDIGGAEVRYLNLFRELSMRSKDYHLIINRTLYEIALQAKLIDDSSQNVKIMNFGPAISHHPGLHSIDSWKEKRVKKWMALRRFKNNVFDLLTLFRYTFLLYRCLKSYKSGIRYLHGVWLGGMIAWPLKYIFKFRFVYSYTDSGFSSIYKGYRRALKNEAHALKHADVLDFLSEELRNGISKYVSLSKRTIVCISPCSFKNYEKLLPSPVKLNTVTFCARMTSIKNPLLFVESIVLFNSQYKMAHEVKFQFLGDGECLPELKLLKASNDLFNVEFFGYQEDPIMYLKDSIIFVSIQQATNYPSQALLEAMACENAIIASDVGETRKLVSENEGILTPLNKQEIADALISLLVNEEKRKRLAKNSRLKVLAEHNIERYLSYFYSLEKIT